MLVIALAGVDDGFADADAAATAAATPTVKASLISLGATGTNAETGSTLALVRTGREGLSLMSLLSAGVGRPG